MSKNVHIKKVCHCHEVSMGFKWQEEKEFLTLRGQAIKIIYL